MEENDQLQDDYAFMKETVKNRPVSGRRICLVLLITACAAVMFGLIAGAIIREMIPETKPATVSIGRDDPSSGTPIPTPAPSPTAKPTQKPTPTPEPTSEPESSSGREGDGKQGGNSGSSGESSGGTSGNSEGGEDELTPEERAEQQLTSYGELYAAMQTVAGNVEPSMVTVAGITSEEDWFNTINESTTTASGLIVAQTDTDLMILTDSRAADGAGRIVITFFDGTSGEAVMRKMDSNTRLCVVSVPMESLSEETREAVGPADLGNSYTLRKGQPVIAVGEPMGYRDAIDFGQVTSSSNIVYLTDCSYPILTTNIGSSADGSGILIDLNSRVVGIIRQDFSSIGSATVTAIPISPLKELIEKLSNQEELCYIGISGQDVTAQLSEQTGIPQGVYVTAVDGDSPSMRAGVQVADVITGIGGASVESMSAYQRQLTALAPDEETVLAVQRRGADGYVEIELAVTIGAR